MQKQQEVTTEPEPTPTPTGRWKYLLLGTLSMILLGISLLAYIYFFHAPDLPLQATLERLDRSEPEGWRFADIQKKRVDPVNSENSAIVVIRTTAAMPSGWWTKSDEEFDKPVADLSLATLLPGPQFGTLVRELQKAKPALMQAQRLADMPEGRHPINWAPDYYSTLLPTVQESRSAARLLGYEARRLAQVGDGDGALRCVQGIVNAGRSIGDEPNAICYLVRLACASVGIHDVERVLALTQPSEPALERMQKLLESEEAHSGLLIALRGERAMADGLMQGIQEGRVDVTKTIGGPGGVQWVQRVPRLVIKSRIALLDFMTEMVEAAKLPPEKQKAAFAGFDQRMRDLPMLAKLFAPAFSRISQSSVRITAQLRCAIVALAAERFRKKQGRWPTAMNELVDAGFLAEPVSDPYDGKPLRLGTFAEGLSIYSVGTDDVDNGGTIRGIHPTGVLMDEKNTDVVFRLWDAPRRRQTPPEAAKTPTPAGSPGR